MSNGKENEQFNKMMTTPIPRLVTSLAVPTVISMMITNIYNVVDTAFVGMLGTSASGAVGIVFGFMAILQSIGFTFGQGSGSIISRKLGAKDVEGATRTASTAFFAAFSLSVLASIVCWFLLTPLIFMLGSTGTIAPYAKTYISFILLSAPCMVCSFTLNNILRYEGKAFLGMVGMMTGAVLNIFGDMFLMFGLDMGIAGAGLSTALSQAIGFGILLYPLSTGKTECQISFAKVEWNLSKVMDIATTGLPSLLRQGLNAVTAILLNSTAAVYGDAAVAAMSIVSRLFHFAFAVAIGIGQGFQPVSGFSFGAKRYDRLKEGYRFTIKLAEGAMLLLGTVMFVFAPFFTELLRDDPEVTVIAVRALRLQCVAIIFLPLCMITEMLMQSTGQKLMASVLSSLRNGILFIPVLLILASWRGLAGIQEAQAVAYILSVPPAVFISRNFFRRKVMIVKNSAEQIIKDFKLEMHPEGGYFAEVYTSAPDLGTVDDKRYLAGSIYFLLPSGEVSHFHQIDCEEIWYYHAGCGMKIYMLLPTGKLVIKKLGLNFRDNELPMVVVPKGAIFAAENLASDGFTFVSCVTVPKFRYSSFRLVPFEEIQQYGVEARLCIK